MLDGLDAMPPTTEKVTSNIVFPTRPTLCDQYITSEIAQLTQYISDFEDKATEQKWLDQQVTSCCNDLGDMIDGLKNGKDLMLSNQNAENGPYIDQISQLTGLTSA